MTDFAYVISEDEDNNLVNLVVNGSLNKNVGEKVIERPENWPLKNNVVFCVTSQTPPLM